MDQQRPSAPIPPDHQLSPPEPDPTRKKGKYWIWALALILLCLILYWGFPHHDQASQSAAAPAAGGRRGFSGPVTLTTATAAKGDIGVYLNAIGTITAIYTDSITAQVTGVITSVHHKEGQLARKGDPLIDIDPRPYEAQVMQVEGALERDRISWRRRKWTCSATKMPGPETRSLDRRSRIRKKSSSRIREP